MPLPDTYAVTRERARKIKIVAEARCEACHEQYPLTDLELHHIPGDDYDDLQRNILILCHLCHLHVHAMPVGVELQRKWTDNRPILARKMIRSIMGYTLKHYTPPEAGDLATIFTEACRSWGLNGSG